jgi:hypothetical protein
VSSLEFPIERFLVTCARETLINGWDARWTESNEGVHSLGCASCGEETWWIGTVVGVKLGFWAGQEEESWRKFKIAVGEYQ